MSNKKKILLVYTNYSSFVRQDHELLSEENEVSNYHFTQNKNLFGLVWQLIKQFLFLLFLGWKYDVIFIWFADYHSLLPVCFAKISGTKSIIVVGGYDVNYLPGFNYGSFNNPVRKFFTKQSFRQVTYALPVAKALENKLLYISPKTAAITIPTIQNENKFSITNTNREKLILTIATVSSYQTFMIKGLDRFAELARLLPDYQFMIIGIMENAKKFFDPIPDNLILHPPVEHEALQAYLNRSSFYLQLSRSEGLPNALCEAMLCGCIPAGMNVGDVKTAIDQFGLTMDEWNPELLSDFIRNNQADSLKSIQIRNHIISKYNPSIRKEKLNEILKQ